VDRTLDDVSSMSADDDIEPAIVVVSGPRRVLPANVDLGRDDFADERMSREHATVRYQRGQWTIRDRDSHNGTFVDGARISGEVVRRGDVVLRCGHTVFALLADGRGHRAEAATGDVVIGPELARCYAQIRRHAASDSLLVYGESGSGKELAARLYHDSGRHAAGPFVAVNCAAIPVGVAERLLFGSKKGAFSGATDAIGHFQSAQGGTLFLDEIADLDLGVQAKLLRVLETREVVPIGGTTSTPLDIGIVAACHRELREAVAEKRFREDLYYRLARAAVHVPPLRSRKVDIARLVERELAAMRLTAHAKLLEACLVRPWPGNVRELIAAVRQAAAEAQATGRDVVRRDDLPEHAGMPHEPEPSAAAKSPDVDKETVVAALAKANGVVSAAARALGLHRTQLYRLMDKFGIARD
jgi:transcriptional regulator with PAS, ATPase and Fis domain